MLIRILIRVGPCLLTFVTKVGHAHHARHGSNDTECFHPGICFFCFGEETLDAVDITAAGNLHAQTSAILLRITILINVTTIIKAILRLCYLRLNQTS